MTLLKTSVVLLLGMMSFSSYAEKDNASDDNQGSKASEIYQLIEVKKRTEDDNSPVGYWEIDLKYPKVNLPGKADVSSTINTSIETLVNQYTCEDGGDRTFTASEVKVDKTSLSFKYESMWMCSTMPGPDFVTGSVSYNLTTGVKISK
ncbi:hypothetical protein TDB9533_03019 [Thalassocella blandensis]|nr:hypothetical protein TDB9533_03019 [Thalassocella blandensis]